MPDKDKLNLDILKKAQAELSKVKAWAGDQHKDAFHKAHSWLVVQEDCDVAAARLAAIVEFVSEEGE